MSDILQLFNEAAEAENQGQYEQASQLYDRILAEHPGHARAIASKKNLNILIKKDADILKKVKDADEAYDAGDFTEAAQLYTSAMAHAADAGITCHHTHLEKMHRQASELEYWRLETQKVLEEAQKYANQERDWGKANERLTRFLEYELPKDERYKKFAEKVVLEQQHARGQMNEQALVEQALAAFENQDYDEFLLLANNIDSTAKQNNFKNLIDKATKARKEIQEYLENAEQAYKDEHWSDAFSHLEVLKKSYENTPTWRRMWLRVAGRWGQVELEAGKVAATQRKFKQAAAHFESAEHAYGEIHEAYKDHKEAREGEREAKELWQLAQFAAQAQQDLDNGRRADALNALRPAINYLAETRENGREYPVLEVILKSMASRVEQELESIRSIGAELALAEQHLKNKEYSQAKTLFEHAATALLKEQQERALDGLKQVETQLRLFESAMENGRRHSNPLEAAKHFKKAYETWPGGPDVLDMFEKTLEQAAEQALLHKNERLVAALCQEILDKNRDNRRANEMLQQMQLAPKVTALLSSVNEKLSNPATTGQVLDAVLSDLDAMLLQAKGQASLKSSVEETRQTVQRRVDALRKGESEARKADAALENGNWQIALQGLESAIQAFGEHKPYEIEERLMSLKNAWKVIEPAQETIADAINLAQKAYKECLKEEGPETVEKALETAEIGLGDVKRELETVKVTMPGKLAELDRQAKDLRKRLDVVQEALTNPQAREALTRVRTQVRILGTDAVLEALEQQLYARVRDELPNLHRQADVEIRSGRIRSAQETLRLANEIDPADVDIQEKLLQVEEHASLRDAIQQAHRTASDESDSPTQALKKLKSGLDAIRNASSTLVGTELREPLDDLFRLAQRDNGLALGKDEHYAEAQRLIAEIGKAQGTSWVALEGSHLADEWLSLARMIALEGVVASATQMGQLLEAYRAASSMLQKNPHDEKLARQEAHTREAMINRQAASAMKRLHWARTALERDAFAEALANLESIETEFFGPVEQVFPTLLEGIDNIEAVREDVRNLQPQILQGQKLYDQVQPILNEALVLFQKNRLEEAETKLGELSGTDLSSSPRLQQRTRELREMVEQARQKNAQRQVQEGLAGVQAGLKLARTAADFQQLQGDLDALKQQVNLNAQPAELQNEYTKLLALVDDEANKLVESGIYKTRGQEALAKENYAGAVTSFTRALDLTRIPEERIELEGLLAQAADQNEKLRGLKTALEDGYSSLEQGDYTRARLAFMKANGFGVDVKLALNLGSAGRLYQDAQKEFENGRCDEAREILTDAQKRISSLLASGEMERADEFSRRWQAVAEELDEQIRTLLEKATRLISKGDERRRKLAEARQAYIDGNLPKAEDLAQEVLDKTSDDLEALAIQGVCAASKLYATGRDDEARSILKQLPEKVVTNPLVMTLLGQIEARYEVNRLLGQAENQARNGEFKAARESLLLAARQNPDKSRYEEAQRNVDGFRQEWEHKTIHPIRDAIRQGEKEGNYADAVRLCETALEQATAGEFQSELKRLLVTAVDQWAQHDYKEFSRQLSELGTEAELGNLKNRLALTLARNSESLPAKIASQLNILEQDTEKKIQQARIERTEEAYKELVQRYSQSVSETELLALKDEVDVVIARDPILAEKIGKKLNALQHDINKKVLRIRIDAVRQLNDPGEWDTAILRLESIRDDADRWDAGGISGEVELLIFNIKQAQSAAQASKTEANRKKVLEQAAQSLKDAKDRADLNRTLEVLKKAQRELGLSQDGEFNHLTAELNEGLSVFDKNEEVKSRVRNQIHEKMFSAAERELRGLVKISPLQSEKIKDLQELVGLLISAEKKQGSLSWESALRDYEQAFKFDSTLRNILSEELEICKENLARDVLSEAENCLQTLPVRIEQARVLLDKAKNWLTPRTENVYNQLYDWMVSQEIANEAMQILLKPDIDDIKIKESQGLLAKAKHSWPVERSQNDLVSWENLANAIDSWNKSDFIEAAQLLEILPEEIKRLQHVKELIKNVQKAKQEQEKFTSANKALDDALKSEDYEKVVAAAKLLEGTPKFAEAVENLQSSFAIYCDSGHYAQAERIGKALADLQPNNETVRRQYIALTQAHAKKYQDLLVSINEYLNNWQLDDAKRILTEAENFSRDSNDDSLKQLYIRYEELVHKDSQIREPLRQFKAAFEAGKSSEALNMITEARKKAVGHPAINHSVDLLRDSLIAQTQAALNSKDFKEADRILQQAGQLRVDDQIISLRRKVDEARESYLREHRRHARRALNAWNIDQVDWAVNTIQEQAPDDISLSDIEKKRGEILQKSEYIFEAFKTAWNSLRDADFTTALRHFERAADYAQDLEEIQDWIQYTRSVRNGVQAVKDGNFYHATGLFHIAEQQLLLFGNKKMLPSLLGGENYVKERRRTAAYNAARLSSFTKVMEDLHKSYEALSGQQAENDSVIRAGQQLVDQVKRFNQSLRMIEAGENYDIEYPAESKTASGNQERGKEQQHSGREKIPHDEQDENANDQTSGEYDNRQGDEWNQDDSESESEKEESANTWQESAMLSDSGDNTGFIEQVRSDQAGMDTTHQKVQEFEKPGQSPEDDEQFDNVSTLVSSAQEKTDAAEDTNSAPNADIENLNMPVDVIQPEVGQHQVNVPAPDTGDNTHRQAEQSDDEPLPFIGWGVYETTNYDDDNEESKK